MEKFSFLGNLTWTGSLTKSVHFDAYENISLEAPTELRSQNTAFLRTSGALTGTGSREDCRTQIKQAEQLKAALPLPSFLPSGHTESL